MLRPANSDPAPPDVPRRWREVRLRDCGWLMRYGWRATCELVKARRRFGHLDLIQLRDSPDVAGLPHKYAGQNDPHLIERVTFIMPRVAALMPFRSDCLIQATGAQAWLADCGVPSRIVIGVERPRDGRFAAHAWLDHNGRIVTGGDVSQYTVLL